MTETKEQFIKRQLTFTGMDNDEFNHRRVVLPCDCNEPGCTGWASIPNFPGSIRMHKQLNPSARKKGVGV